MSSCDANIQETTPIAKRLRTRRCASCDGSGYATLGMWGPIDAPEYDHCCVCRGTGQIVDDTSRKEGK